MKRCVVTGASGLIGSHLVPRLGRDWQVHAVSRHPTAGLADGNVVWHQIDLARDFDQTELPAQIEAVVYLAQSEHFRAFPERAPDIFEVNTMGLLRFLHYARRSGAHKFVLASSGGVYGSADTSLNEDLPVLAQGDLGFYLGSKLCAEIVALNYAKLMSVTVLRFFFVYGPGQRRSMLIPRLIDNIRQGHTVTLQGRDGIRLNPTYVTDGVAAIDRALQLTDTHKINVAGPNVLSLRDVCNLIGQAVGRKPSFTVAQESPKHIVGDIERMKALLGPPEVSFDKGLQLMLASE